MWARCGNGKVPSMKTKVALALVLTACAAPTATPSAEPRPEPVATFELSANHRLEFYAPADGPAAVVEMLRIGETPLLAKEAGTRKASDIYRLVAGPDATIPTAISLAEGRTTTASDIPPPPLPSVATETNVPSEQAPVFYTTSDQLWFKANFCNTPAGYSCVQGFSWATSGWGSPVNAYSAHAMNGSEARGNRTMEVSWWNGSAPVRYATASLPPGWHWYMNWNDPSVCSDNSPKYWFESSLQDNGSNDNAQVSLAIRARTNCLDGYVGVSGGGGGVTACSCPAACPTSCTATASGCRC
jgi:hypothetical protein